MSRISVDVSSARIPVLQVGYQGENEVTDVLFDISSWITEFGEGVAQLRVKRPGNSEEESYVLSLTITDGTAVWTVSETDTFNKGNGKVQLSYMVGNIVKKAVIYPYKVGKSIVGADNPVDPFDSWIERSKAWAIGKTLDGGDVPETDETYQNNAKYYAEQADILGSAQVVLATEQATLATAKATLATEKANAAAESEANAAVSEAAVNGVSTQLTTRMSAIETEQSVQSARMDTFTSLPEGSTSGNAELADIRVGANGTTYDTAGNAVRGQIGELKSDIDNFFAVGNLVDSTKTATGYYIGTTTGELISNASYFTTDYIEVNAGDTIQFSSEVRFLCAFSRNKSVEAGAGAENIRSYVVPNNICYIRVSSHISYFDSFNSYISESWEGFKPFGINPIDKSFDTLNRKCVSSLGANGFRTQFSLSQSTTKEFSAEYPSFNKVGDCISFRGEFDTFDVLYIGKGYYRSCGAWLEITNTKVSIKTYNGSVSSAGSWEHGLTFEDFIYVVINTNNLLEVQFTIATKTGSYTMTPQRSYDFLNIPFVRSGTNMTNCKFSMTNDAFSKPLWVFGDSYWGLTTDRIYGALRQLGYPNIYVNSLSGQTSQGAYNDLVKAFKFGSPKYLVWCLGLNDTNLDDYKKFLLNVANYCANNGTELIVSKVPSVPNRNKTEQHGFIDSMNFRFVDFNSAVGATSDGTWYDGMLSADSVHPTNLGAKMMSMQMFVDVPEIANYGKI